MSASDGSILFTPFVPPRPRANCWTSDAQVAFIAALARTGVVAVAARGVGKSPRSAYQLRVRPGAESFADAWDRALSEGQARAIDAALSRTLEPVMVPVIRRGRQVGLREKFDSGLAIAAMRALDGANGRWLRTAASASSAAVDRGKTPDDYLFRYLSGDVPA